MQENIVTFVDYFGQAFCFEFTITAARLTPEEFSRRMNSFLTNFLREVMPDRIAVIEPHDTGHAHQHTLVAMPFSSPNFDHESLKLSREAFNRKDFRESKRLWAKVRASMSPEHAAMWDLLQRELPKYGLGKQIGFAPVRETSKHIACYFGKYLAKGLASRPDAWKRVRLVRYSGTNGQEVPSWKNSSPLRTGNSVHDQNRRDKVRAVAQEMGCTTSDEVKSILGTHWHYHGREMLARVQPPIYRSVLHADADKLPVPLPPDTDFRMDADEQGLPVCRAIFPDWSYLPWSPPETCRRLDAVTPREAALLLLDQAAPFSVRAASVAAMLRVKTGSTNLQPIAG